MARARLLIRSSHELVVETGEGVCGERGSGRGSSQPVEDRWLRDGLEAGVNRDRGQRKA